MKKMETPLVSICCLTYNQASFIRQCLDGFLMQKTSFPFEVLIHDDASADGTIDIIWEYQNKYPSIIKPYIQKVNQYSQGKGFVGLQINFDRSKGKYIAICEGDDYWIDPLKLQKQVDYLELNSGCSLCYHACRNEFTNGCSNILPICENVKTKYEFRDILVGYPFQTATIVFRAGFLKSHLYKHISNIGFSSIILFLALSQYGAVEGINEQMSVYRRNEAGVTVADSKNLSNSLLQNLIFLGDCLDNDSRKVLYELQVIPQMIILYSSSRKQYYEVLDCVRSAEHSMTLFVMHSVMSYVIKQRLKNYLYLHK